jgi:RNA polymerase sigma factor (sigma-70 family)
MPISSEQLASLIDRHAVPLQIWAGRRSDTAEDIVQEAFCRLAILKHPPDHPVAWLYRVVRNLAESDRLASRRRNAREEAVAATEQYHTDVYVQFEQDEAVKAVWELESHWREVVTARIWGELTFEEIGQLCDISTATASRRFREALEQLRTKLESPCPTNNS